MKLTDTRFRHSAFRLIALISLWAGWVWGSISAQPVITTGPRSQFAWEGKRVSLYVTATGTPPLGYQWQRNGINIINATNRSLSFSKVQLTDSGDFRVVVTDSTGSLASDPGQLLVRSWPTPTGPRVPELARLDTNMQTVILNHGIPGGSLAVVKDGRLVFARGYGWANVEKEEQFYPDSLSQIASLSKTITAATVMKLIEEGKLTLTNRAFNLLALEPFPYSGAVKDSRLTNITIRHLLNHTAGWDSSTARNPSGGAGFDAVVWPALTSQELGLTQPATPNEFVRWILGKPLQFNPGSGSSYSSVGFLVAGRVVEAITGQSFDTAARQLLAKAGITRTQIGRNTIAERFPSEVVYYLHPSVTAADIVGQYNWAEPKPLDENLPYAYPLTTLEAAAGFISSAIDHARFVAAIDGLSSFPDILTTTSINVMASDMLGWDSFLSSGTDPQSSIWGKLGFLPGSISKAVKWRNGIILVYFLNTWEKGADPELYDGLTASLSNITWPPHDFFATTLSYEAWSAKHFSLAELADPTLSGEQADPDGDGLPTLLEYSQGMNPRLGNDPLRLKATLNPGEDGVTLSVSFRRLLLEHELDYRLESSANLQTWSPVVGKTTETLLNPDGTITVSVSPSPSAPPITQFFRLLITRR